MSNFKSVIGSWILAWVMIYFGLVENIHWVYVVQCILQTSVLLMSIVAWISLYKVPGVWEKAKSIAVYKNLWIYNIHAAILLGTIIHLEGWYLTAVFVCSIISSRFYRYIVLR